MIPTDGMAPPSAKVPSVPLHEFLTAVLIMSPLEPSRRTTRFRRNRGTPLWSTILGLPPLTQVGSLITVLQGTPGTVFPPL